MTTPATTEASVEERATLRTVRNGLVSLHKILLDRERERFEREHGRIETTHQHLQLVLEHPMFAWLRPLSGLIARFDDRLLGREPLTAADARRLAADARALTTFADEKTEYQQQYHRALEDSPDILAAHASVARYLAPFRDTDAAKGASPGRM
jgi:hypothetical protein